jgi:hypothetical protein
VRGQQRADQQGTDAVDPVDPDLLTRQRGDGGDARLGRDDQRAVFGARMEAWVRMRNLAPAASAAMYAT